MEKKPAGGRLSLWLARLSCWLLAAVFLIAGIPKLLAPYDFAAVIAMYGLLPTGIVKPVAFVLPVIELITATGLLFMRRWSVVLAAVQIGLFIAVLSYGIHLGLDVDCGCFGPDEPEHDAVSGLRSALLRDLLLCLPLFYSWWFFHHSKTLNKKRS